MNMDMEDKIMVRPAWMSLVMGISSFPALFVPVLSVFLSAALAIAGIGSGVQAIRVIRSDPSSFSGMGLAIAGLIVSALAGLIFIPWAVLLILTLTGAAVMSF